MPDNPLAELLGDFLLEADERVARVENLLLALPESGSEEAERAIVEIGRELHTLKGNSGMMGFTDLQDKVHGLEDLAAALDPGRPEPGTLLSALDGCRALIDELRPPEARGAAAARPGELYESSVRVPLGRLQRLMDLSSELVISRNRLSERMTRLRAMPLAWEDEEPAIAWESLDEAVRLQNRILEGIQREVRDLRMVPLGGLFGGLRRMAHDEAARTGKSVRFETEGGDTPLDRSLVETASESLGHLIRNAVIHGVETGETRRRRGKPEAGTLLLRAAVRSGTVQIEVLDDGRGVDRRRLAEAAERAGHRPQEDLTSLLFLPGVTTRERVDMGAGRGQGLFAVRQAVLGCGGDLEVASVEEVGTRFCLRLPLSVATTEALSVETDGEEYVLPVAQIVEIVSRRLLDETSRDGTWRGRPLPRIDLGVFLGTSRAAVRRPSVVVLEVEGVCYGLEVDRTGELLEIVIQDLDEIAGPPPGFAGGTVLGDGRVAMILDPHALAPGRERREVSP